MITRIGPPNLGLRAALKQRVQTPLILAGLATLAVLSGLLLVPRQAQTLLRFYLIALAALAGITLVRVIASAHEQPRRSLFEALLRRRLPPEERLQELLDMKRDVAMSISSGLEFNYRLRRLLWAVAGHRLASRRRFSLEGDPDRTRALLGDKTWELLAPKDRWDVDRRSPGVPISDLEAVVSLLESL